MEARAWAEAAETAEQRSSSGAKGNEGVVATATKSGRTTGTFLVRRASEGEPRWAVSEASVDLPGEACTDVDSQLRSKTPTG
jgi:hypothetical protein